LQQFAQKISNGQGAQITVVPALMYLFYWFLWKVTAAEFVTTIRRCEYYEKVT
jgi:hypothetical protein